MPAKDRLGIPLLARVVLCCALAIGCFASSRSAHAQGGNGIDVVMLVDVSSSMLMKDRTGNDKDRLRWDAVKIVLDLLCEEDRILIAPFNSNCPARYPDTNPLGKFVPNPKAKFVPGKLPSLLQKVDEDRGNVRAQLEKSILSFIHTSEEPPKPTPLSPVDPDGYNADSGGTGILGALRFAKQELSKSRPIERMAFVILLTDGGQDIFELGPRDDEKDDLLHKSGDWKTDEDFTYFRDARIPIYALGLGLKEDEKKGKDAYEFLKQLAEFSGGKPQLISSNHELVATFRDLIWNLRACWKRSVRLDSATAVVHSGKIGQALDVGLLVYQESLNPADGRKQFAPNPPLKLAWEGVTPGVNNPVSSPRTGKFFPGAGPSGHAFYYFDGRSDPADPAMGALFERQPELQLRIEPGASLTSRPIDGFLVKRLPVRFDVPRLKSRYLRHQPIPLQVVMHQDKPRYKASQFIVHARLIPKNAGTTFSSPPFVLQSRDDTGTFDVPEGSFFTAASLPHSADLLDEVKLVVKVREAGAPENGFELELLHPDLSIENTIQLEAPSALHIQYSPVAKPGESIVRTRYPMHGEVALDAMVDYPKSADAKLFRHPEAKDFALVAAGSPAGTFNLRNGELKITGRVAIAKDEPPPKLTFNSGEIRLFSQDKPPFRLQIENEGTPGEFVSIPVHLLLGNVALKVTPESIRPLVVGPDNSWRAVSFHVGIVGNSEKELGAIKVDVSLDLAGQPIPFETQELWLQPKRDAGSPVTRLQLIENNEELWIYFRPLAARHKDLKALIGAHHCTLRVEGGGFKAVEKRIELQVEPPQLEVQPSLQSFVRSPGKALTAEYGVRMKWLPEGTLPFQLVPADPLQKDPQKSPEMFLQNKSEVGYYYAPFTTTQPTFQLTAPKENATAGWTKIAFAVTVPEKYANGEEPRRATYRGKAQVRLGQLLRAELPFQLRLDGLSAEFPCLTAQQIKLYEQEQLAVPKPATIDKIELVQFFDSPATAIVSLRCDSLRDGFKFVPNLLRPVNAKEREFLTNAEFRDLVPAPEFVAATLDADGALKVELRLPAVRNAYPDSPYAGELTFSYQDNAQQTDFGEIKLPVVLKFVDPQTIIVKSQK